MGAGRAFFLVLGGGYFFIGLNVNAELSKIPHSRYFFGI